MKTTPLVSVIMLVYNNETFLRDSIESILQQTYRNFELLILSAENTNKESLAIIESINDPHIIHIRRDRNSNYVSTARNLGINRSKGVYIAYMDSDDIALPNRLDIEVRFMERHRDITIAGAYAKTFGTKSGILMRNPLRHEDIKASLLFHTSMVNPTTIIRKDAINRYELRYDEGLKYCEDLDFWSRAIHKVKFANIPKVLLLYRTHEKQLSREVKDVQEEVRDKIFQRQLDSLGIKNDNDKRIVYRAIRNFRAEETSPVFLENAEKWLKDIVSINLSRHAYEQKVLENELAEKWLNLCRVSMQKIGYFAWRVFWRSEIHQWLKKEPRNIGRLMKFFIEARLR